jgi:hypothetical protein
MAEKKVIELEIQDNTQNLKKRFAEAKKELQAMAAAYGENSTQAIQAAKKAAELKDIIDDSAEAIKNLQGGGTFKALSTSLGSVASGFGAVQGAVNLLGVESGQVEQALLKVQSAMALAEGLRGLEDAGRAFGALKSTVVDGFKGMSNASKAFIATGIGLIITAIATAIAYSDELGQFWDELTGKSSNLRIAQEALNETVQDYNKGAQEAITKVNKVGSSFELAKKGVISKEEALKTYNDTLGDSLGKATSYNEAEKIFRDKTDAYIKATALRAQANALLNKAAEEQANALTAQFEDQTSFTDKLLISLKSGGNIGKKELKELAKAQAEGVKAEQANANKRAKIFQDEATKLLEKAENLDKANNIETESDNKKTETLKNNNDKRKNDLDELSKFEQEIHDKRLSQWEQEILAVQRKYDEQIAIAKKYGKDLTVLEEGLQAEIQLINNKYVAEEKEAIDQLTISKQKKASDEISIDMQKNIAILEANKKRIEEEKAYDAQQLELKKQVEQAKLSFVTDGLNLISEISDLFSAKNEKQARRDFAIKKALGITQATISAIEGTQNAFTTASASPITSVFPAYPFIQAGVAGAFGAVKVASIAKQQFGGSSSVSASTVGGGASTSTTGVTTSNPTFNVVGGASTNPLANLAPFKAYVVSGEVTTAQELERNIIQKSVL